jgi:outer membrane lipopolysaccharide assembly protein LptE/RlpB
MRKQRRWDEQFPSAAKAGIQDSPVIAAVKRCATQNQVRHRGFSSRIAAALLFGVSLMLASIGCGYHTTGNKVDLPQNIHTIAIPGFVSHSQTFRIEQLLTDAVVREFNARTQYRVVHDAKSDADAVLKATVISATANPLAYDSQTGRAVSALVTVSVQVTLTDRQGKVLFDNPSYLFHDQYELSRDLPSFFQEDSPAVDRLSRDFARTLVANILEAY